MKEPIAQCDRCGAPIFYGNRPDGTPNGVTLKDCHGIPGNNLTLCADCIVNIGIAEMAKRTGGTV